MPTYQAKKPEAPQSGNKYHVDPGVYRCEVFTAEEKTSKRKPDGTGGNPMIELVLKVMLPNGKTGPDIRDYLVFTPKSGWKIDAFRASSGEAVLEGDAELTAESCETREVVAMIGDKPGDKEGVFWNTIEYYLHGEERAEFLSGKAVARPVAKPTVKPAAVADGDDIPF
jgi:hypothetical protein